MKTLRFFAVLSMALMIFTACGEKIGSGAEQGDDGALQEELSVLFIGNSFTMDAVTHLPGMLSAAGIKKVHMVHMYYGGRPVSQYLKGWETFSDYTMYECLPGSNVWTETKNTNLSQAYSDNAKIGQASLPYVTWADHTGMWTVVSAFARKVMDNIPFDGIISTGAMLENLRTSTINNSKYLTRDGFHMDKGIACYGASCTVFETIFTPVYNVKTSDISYTTSVSDANTTPVTSSNAPVAREAAKYAVLFPYTVKKMN